MAPPLKNIIAAANLGSTVDSGALPKMASSTREAAPLSRTRKDSARPANRFRSLSTKIGSKRGSDWRSCSGGMLPIIIPVAVAL